MADLDRKLEYVLEVRSDELPVAEIRPALRALVTRLFEELMASGLAPAEILTASSCRRLALCLRGLPEREPDRSERILGPPAPESGAEANAAAKKARREFAAEQEVDEEELTVANTERGPHLSLLRQHPGRPAAEVLRDLVPRLLRELPWTAKPCWGGPLAWARPVRGLLSVLQGEILDLHLDGLESTNVTTGQPVHTPRGFTVEGWESYLEHLASVGIEPRFQERRRQLRERLHTLAAEAGGKPVLTTALLDRLAYRVEVPGALTGDLDPAFLELPEEAVLAALERRMDAVGVRGPQGLVPRYLVVMDREDDPEGAVRRGTERAALGHLLDLRFLYEGACRRTLEERRGRLSQLGLSPRPGTLAEQQERVRILASLICEELGWHQLLPGVEEAAALLRTDLTIALVRELPDLRGVAGGLLARAEGRAEAVWQAVYDQYRPETPEQPVPRGPLGQALALAWRLDTLVGLFGLGIQPVGRKDPYNLRTVAEGLVRILIEGELQLDLDLVAAQAIKLQPQLEVGSEALLAELQPFLQTRVRTVLGQSGFGHDEIEAAMAVAGHDLPDLRARVAALAAVREEAGFRDLVEAAQRIDSMVRGAAEHELHDSDGATEAERSLDTVLQSVRRKVAVAVGEGQYEQGLRHMLDLVPALQRFFAEVLVMDANPSRRAHRLALLQAVRRVFWRVARLKELSVAPP